MTIEKEFYRQLYLTKQHFLLQRTNSLCKRNPMAENVRTTFQSTIDTILAAAKIGEKLINTDHVRHLFWLSPYLTYCIKTTCSNFMFEFSGKAV